MTYIKRILVAIVAVGGLLLLVASVAQAASQADATKIEATYTEGEVKRVDMSSGKITIKHGFIQNLEMPPMTMVFTVKEKALLNDIAVGDQVRFIVVSDNGKMVITEMIK